MIITTFACPTHRETTWQPPWRQLFSLLSHRQVNIDVLIATGILRWSLNLQRTEVRCELERRGIHLSEGEISHLSDEFLVRYHVWFDASRARWAPRLKRGLILLIDGTQKDGGRVTYRAIAYRQGVTVHAASIKSENEDDLVEFLETVKKEIGTPRLILRDGSAAAKNACNRVFPKVPQGLCHWHFLRNIGESLLSECYKKLRDAVLATKQLARLEDIRKDLAATANGEVEPERRVLRVLTRLALEDVLGARDSVGGAPFRLAYLQLMDRVEAVREQVNHAVVLAQDWNLAESGLLESKKRLNDLWDAVKSSLLVVRRRWSWFSRLRSWLRLDGAGSGRPAEPTERSDQSLDEQQVARRIYAVRAEAQQAGPGEEKAWLRVVSRFEEHREELFPRVRLRGVPRTTALIEVAHREDQRSCRRRMGTLNTRVAMERVGEHLAVWSNMGKSWFARYALKGVDLGEVFMEQDVEEVRAGLVALRGKRWRDRLPVAAGARVGLLGEFVELAGRGASVGAFVEWADRVEGVV